MSIRVKITLDQPATPAHRREMGPISMQFEVPMYNVSGLQVRSRPLPRRTTCVCCCSCCCSAHSLHASSSAVYTTLQVRYLRIAETDKGYNPHRWVRYITSSSSYVFRM